MNARPPSLAPGIVTEMVEGELLVYRMASAKAIYLNQSASMILALCDGERTEAEIAALIGQAYPEADPEMPAEVATILAALRADNILA